MKSKKYYLSFILTLIMSLNLLFTPVMATPNNEEQETNIIYTMESNVIVEKMSFIDSDGLPVFFSRKIYPNGTAQVTMTKNNVASTEVFNGYNYEMYYAIATSDERNHKNTYIPHNTGEIMPYGSEISGSQYKHIYISQNSGTIYREDLKTISDIISVILSITNSPASNLYDLASEIYFSLPDDVDHVTITESVYEVHLSYDNSYYTHCYHDYVKEFNSKGNCTNSFWDYRQSVGG